MIRSFLAWCAFLVVWSVVIPAAASVNIPLDDWTYEAIEKLAAAGLTDDVLFSSRPMTREAMAVLVENAVERIRNGDMAGEETDPVLESLLLRLMKEFAPELRSEGGWTPRYRIADPLSVESAPAFLENQPSRSRDNHEGEDYEEGNNFQARWRTWFAAGDHLGLSVQPEFFSSRNRTAVRLQEGVASLEAFDVRLEAGRESLWWGPGFHGSLLLSDNAPPFDLIKFSTPRPFYLWPRWLGRFKVSAFFTRLGENRDFPQTRLSGYRFEYAPASWLEFGTSRMTMWDGRGRDHLSFSDYLKVLFGKPNQSGRDEVNELASIDFRLSVRRLDRFYLPFPEIQFYGEWGGEDEAGYLPTKNAYLGGAFIPRLFGDAATDFRVEVARNHVNGAANVWYNHGVFTDGYTFRGDVIGHHMGSDSEDATVRMTRRIDDAWKVGVQFDYEKHGLSNPVQVISKRPRIDLEWRPNESLTLTGSYEYERVDNPGAVTGLGNTPGTPGKTENNHFIGLKAAWVY